MMYVQGKVLFQSPYSDLPMYSNLLIISSISSSWNLLNFITSSYGITLTCHWSKYVNVFIPWPHRNSSRWFEAIVKGFVGDVVSRGRLGPGVKSDDIKMCRISILVNSELSVDVCRVYDQAVKLINIWISAYGDQCLHALTMNST